MNASDAPGGDGMTGTVAVVTGATGALGAATAGRLVAAGAAVHLVGRDGDALSRISASLGPTATAHRADPTDPAALEDVLAGLAAAGTPAGALVHAVGSTLLKPAHTTSDDELAELFRVNVGSAFAALRSFVRALPRDRGGAVVLFSSAATRIGLVNHEAISAAKGAIDGLVTSAAATYAGRRIRVNAIAPGLVVSDLTRRLVENEATRRASEAMHPLGRLGEADEIGALAAFLVSDDASWITGQTIVADGGLSGVKLPPSLTAPR